MSRFGGSPGTSQRWSSLPNGRAGFASSSGLGPVAPGFSAPKYPGPGPCGLACVASFSRNVTLITEPFAGAAKLAAWGMPFPRGDGHEKGSHGYANRLGAGRRVVVIASPAVIGERWLRGLRQLYFGAVHS